MVDVLGAAPELYFMNRLGSLRRSQELTASMQFDLASSPLDDDQIDEVTTAFGGNASATGFGFSEAFRDILSREPQRVPTPEIGTLQSNLIRQGYAPVGAEPDGTWTPDWYAYFRRWDRDNYEKVLAGKHWGAAPIEAGLRVITDTLPSMVWKNLVGAATGLIDQTTGTATEEGSLERLGLLGGAAGGAAIGGIVGGPIGAGVGAVAGGVVGFFADVFGEEPEEIDQSVGGMLLDALSPFEEYADKGWKAFWTDLGYIGTAASLVSGAKMAVGGARAVMGGIQATAAESNVPALTAALARPATARPGFATNLITGAMAKGGAPGTAKWVTEQAIRFGPMAQMQRPLFQVVNKAYTGAATAGIGARLAAGFDAGTGAVGQTAIEKSIVETDPLASGISLPFLGDAVDWAAFILVPERFFPWNAGALGKASRRMMGGEGSTAMWPLIHAAMASDGTLSTGKARALIKDIVDDEMNTSLMLDFGVHTEASVIADATGVNYNKAKAGVIDDLHGQARAITDPYVPPPFLPETKVVAGDEPLRVYHGTTNDFDNFKASSADPDNLYGPGFYFTEDPTIASGYARTTGGRARAQGVPNVRFGYLDVKNPFQADGYITKEQATRILNEAEAAGLPKWQVDEIRQSDMWIYGDEIPADNIYRTIEKHAKANRESEFWEGFDYPEGVDVSKLGVEEKGRAFVNKVLQNSGYDGITHIGGPQYGSAKFAKLGAAEAEKLRHRVWIAFDPVQVHGGIAPPKGAVPAPGAAPDLPRVSALSIEMTARAVRDPEKFAAWLVTLPGEGIKKFEIYKQMHHEARNVTRRVRDGQLLVTDTPAAFIAGPGGLEVAGIKGKTLQTAQLEAEADNLATQIKTQTRRVERAANPEAHASLQGQLDQLKARQSVVKSNLARTHAAPAQVQELNVMPARQDFMTRKDLYNMRREYNELRAELKANNEAGLVNDVDVGKKKMSVMLHDMAEGGYIPDKMMLKALDAGANPGDEISKHLDEIAKEAARDVELPADELRNWTDKGYKPVVTGESVLQLDEIGEISEVMGIGNYTKRAAFFETLGLNPTLGKDENITALKIAHERTELGHFFEKNDLAMNGVVANGRIRKYIQDQNRSGVAWGPFLKRQTGRPVLPLVDSRQLTPEDLFKIFEDVPGFTPEHASSLMGALKRGASLGAEVKFKQPMVSARALGRTMRVSGLPGFQDYMRTLKVPVTPKMLGVAAGAAVGAAGGALLDEEDRLGGALRGAQIGAGVGFAGAVATRRSYGYLPDALARMNLALRYTFSLTFDMGRYTEAAMMAGARYGIRPTFAPHRKVITEADGWRSPITGEVVHGEEAWKHGIQFQDELNGTVYFGGLEDMERRVFQAGMLGFKPRDFEAYYGLEMYQRGWSNEKIKEAVANINRYGVGRTAAEKTANFVFFPFSFSKKFLTTMGDFILQAPGRNLLLHEGMRRYHESSLDERFHDLIENHLPLLDQLAQVNTLSYGLSPGRFFLEGLTDHRTAAGWAGQILASVLVPGGSATPIAAATGQAGDLALQAFIPVVITGESLDRASGIDGLDDIMRRYIPFIREIDQYFVQSEGGKVGPVGGAIGEQVAAVSSPTHETPYAQLTGYLDELRAFKEDLEPMALALGYTSTDGLLASDIGAAWGGEYEQLKNDLRIRYPQGWAMVSEIDNTSVINEAAMNDLTRQVQDGHASTAEEQILLIQQEARWQKTLSQNLGLPADLGNAMIGSTVRSMAKKYRNDPRFMELYRRFFEREYGPLEVIYA